MRKAILIPSLVFICFANITLGQVISQSQVPSVIVNYFQQNFIKAVDIKWKLDGELYKVEFETGYNTDHEVWYDKAGKQVCHKEEISKKDLPQNVQDKITANFGGYRVDDVKKVVEENKINYMIELKSFTEEWKVVLDKDGNVLSKIAD